MKKLSWGILLMIFLLSFGKAFAQSTPSAQIRSVQYDLPYTGILPDNPLYFLKALRDNILNLFITDPVKKSEYDLLMADKRLSGAQALLEKGKDDLAITTLSKSGNYFYQAIQLTATAKRQGEDANGAIATLVTASMKHQAVIYQMIQEAKPSTKGNLELLLSRTQGFQSSVEQLKSSQ
jgi:hypothetical protein